ncbi:meso-butanediol dehydrogenase / (S,S)-butanediol dehydrogenase / diacetyl reductase [Microlunatus sagamiharensis]|uniref:Meso-butanediol dehydrogenase / (S,S)-butanediol dehydrogenase / diacetyl reductase n=1 Tax=Microlunatus sagamiharensis TaxID=546874 RepID=A0A1H2MH11_9ACTN|nr:SDR family oxidoreductase [Microlunatus sagamiharensis]SDU92500.1 meso-butanediol dehydrogenase / (S,S)-butanediol dehydrogenase / diacetyl reductase [Microlunatus sagamiharensis]
MSGARSAFVTGAAGGIGRAVAVRLAADGLAVTVVDLNGAQDALDALADELGAGALALGADVADSASVDAAVAAHVEHHGGLDVMVANAGIAVTAPLVETNDEQWRRVMDVNVGGVFHCYRAAARQLIAQGRGGRIIGAASVAAHRAGKWQSAYSASKFAVRGMSQSLAQELGEHGITVNVYSPGVVQTPMWDAIDVDMAGRRGTAVGSEMQAMVAGIPLGRLEVPTDVAGVVSFLASPDAAYVTGQSIVVDGGMWFS